MSKDPDTAEELRKLTVIQLRVICKQRKITSYSKLHKNAIIGKLLEQIENTRRSSTIEETQRRQRTHNRVATGLQEDDQERPSAIPVTQLQKSDSDKYNSSYPASSTPEPALTSVSMISGFAKTTQKRASEPDNMPLKRSKLTSEAISLTEKFLPTTRVQSNYSPMETPAYTEMHEKRLESAGFPRKNRIIALRKAVISDGSIRFQSAATLATVVPSTILPKTHRDVVLYKDRPSPGPLVPMKRSSPKRFIPLIVDKVKDPDLVLDNVSEHLVQADRKLFISHYLNFPILDYEPLTRVALPPPLSQRKHVARLAVAFTCISTQDLPNLIQVSRLFRYAVYLSAQHRLLRSFPGLRLASLLKQYPSNMTDMWPYLRQRQREQRMRRHMFRNSFLGRALQGQVNISDHLWTSPDNAKQASIAVRFLLTRLYFMASIGNEYISDREVILDVQELVEGEIWSVTIGSSTYRAVLYVLEATCEVVGHPPSSPTSSSKSSVPANIPLLRADWSAYINRRISCPLNTGQSPSLLEHLKWTNHEEYDRGISKLWLQRILREGEIGTAKRTAAERYILASVVGNSISGRWMSSTEMAQEFNGLSSRVACPEQKPRVHLFLPAYAFIQLCVTKINRRKIRHHHVESLHFTSSDGGPLHPALAVVQTPSRECYILRDNGMQIGCEESGIATIWTQMLQCSLTGKDLS